MSPTPLTGLPFLPEGLFWRVGPYAASDSYFSLFLYSTEINKGIAVQIIEPYTEWEVPKNKKGKNKKNAEPREVTKERVLHFEHITVPQEKERTIYEDVRGSKVAIVEKYMDDVKVRDGDLTPELIQTFAQKAYHRYNEILRSRELLGDYPPKTLPGISEPAAW